MNRQKRGGFKTTPKSSTFGIWVESIKKKLMGMWLLLLRTAKTKKRNEFWFVVNGVLLHYSLRDHALITGFDCHKLPPRYEELGSLDFVRRIFAQDKKITVKNVKHKLTFMKTKTHRNRLQLVALYFLARVIGGKTKQVDGYIDSFILRVVDDLELCKTFPWRRLMFEDNINKIIRLLNHLDGKVSKTTSFHGFSIPLQVLAFEHIFVLSNKYREDVSDVLSGCPRMCKKVFKSCNMSGYPLEDLYEMLGKIKL